MQMGISNNIIIINISTIKPPPWNRRRLPPCTLMIDSVERSRHGHRLQRMKSGVKQSHRHNNQSTTLRFFEGEKQIG
jgi:hypothetical protein